MADGSARPPSSTVARTARPLTICFYCDGWPTFYPMHGPARYVQTLAQGLVALGVRVHIVTAHPTIETDFVEHGYSVHSRQARPFRLVSRFQPGLGESYHLWRAIQRLDQQHRFDVVEFTNVEGVGYFTAREGRLPTVIRVHTTAFDGVRLGAGMRDLERGYARLERWCAHKARALVTHTNVHRRQVALDYGLPAELIHIVPHGIKPGIPDHAVMRHPLQVLTVGAASPRKGVGFFLKAAAILVDRVPGIHFIWVGTDTPTSPGGTTWAAFAAKHYPTLAGRLEFRSGLGDSALASLYLESGCYLCTSRYESFGLTIVEAMMAGLPVLAPGTAAMSELIQDGTTGWLFEPDNTEDLVTKLIASLRDHESRQRVIANAGRVAQVAFDADVMATRMLELYRGLR